MVRDAVPFLPPTLKGVMRLYVRDLQRGVDEAGAFRDQLMGSGLMRAEGPAVAEALDREMRDVAELIRSHQPFAVVFYRFGRVIGPATELNVPLHHGAPEDPLLQGAHRNFEQLATAAAPKFRILFGGYQDDLMRTLEPRRYFLDSWERSATVYPVLRDAMVANGQLVPAETFDYRSIPFGVASIAYSRSVNDVVRIWCAIWREAGGDMSNRPY
jgi:hypothetical protein